MKLVEMYRRTSIGEAGKWVLYDYSTGAYVQGSRQECENMLPELTERAEQRTLTALNKLGIVLSYTYTSEGHGQLWYSESKKVYSANVRSLCPWMDEEIAKAMDSRFITFKQQ